MTKEDMSSGTPDEAQLDPDSAIPEAGRVISRLDDFWDQIAEKTGKGHGVFIKEIFGVMWSDGSNGADEERRMENWHEESEEMQPLALVQAAMVACAYAIDSMKAQKSGQTLQAWKFLAKSKYWLGITVGTWSIRQDQKLSINDVAIRGATERHAENRAMKAEVFEWLNENMKGFKSLDSAAESIAGKIAPVKFRTARSWIGEWKKIQSAGKL